MKAGTAVVLLAAVMVGVILASAERDVQVVPVPEADLLVAFIKQGDEPVDAELMASLVQLAADMEVSISNGQF